MSSKFSYSSRVLRTSVMGLLSAAVVMVLVLTGCGIGDQKYSTAKEQQVLEDREGTFDFSTPPSREEAGMPKKGSQFSFQRNDHKSFHVRVLLPEGKELSLDPELVGFDSMNAVDPETGPPTTSDIHVYFSSLEKGRDHLREVAEEFGLNTADVDRWYDDAKDSTTKDVKIKTPWMKTSVGYVTLSIQGRYAPPNQGEDQTIVHYLLTWKAE